MFGDPEPHESWAEPYEPEPSILDGLKDTLSGVADTAKEAVKGATINNLPLAGTLYVYRDGGVELTETGRYAAMLLAAYVVYRFVYK